jgi:Uma2 family endonuclease
MPEAAEKRMSLAEFLEWDDGTDTRYELVGGQPVAMAPPSGAHAVIVINLGRQIGNRLKPPCYVAAEAGVVAADRADAWYQADLVVSCSPLESGSRWIPDPVLIVEVLSPSTAQHDRGTKLFDYREVPSVQEILLVSSEARRVEIWRREGARWIVETLIGDAELHLAAVDEPVPLSAIYDNVPA